MLLFAQDLHNVISAREFVWWFNGHPDAADLPVDLSKARLIHRSIRKSITLSLSPCADLGCEGEPGHCPAPCLHAFLQYARNVSTQLLGAQGLTLHTFLPYSSAKYSISRA